MPRRHCRQCGSWTPGGAEFCRKHRDPLLKVVHNLGPEDFDEALSDVNVESFDLGPKIAAEVCARKYGSRRHPVVSFLISWNAFLETYLPFLTSWRRPRG